MAMLTTRFLTSASIKLLTLACLISASPVFGQGLVIFNNRAPFGFPSGVIAPIFGVDPDAPYSQKYGNPRGNWNGTDGPLPIPLGMQDYNGTPLHGIGYTATLWAANSTNADPTLRLISITTFRMSTASTLRGAIQVPPIPTVIPDTPGDDPTQRARFQLRVWDNRDGTITNWDQVLLPENNGVARGWSQEFIVPVPLGGGTRIPPNLVGLESFQLFILPPPPPPILACSNVVAECTGDLTPVQFTANAIDFKGSNIVVTCNPPSGTSFAPGETSVSCLATDRLGQSNECSFVVSVRDTAAPTITCPSDIVVTATNLAGNTIEYHVEAVDTCGLQSIVCLPPSRSVFPVGATTVNCVATDSSTNSSSCHFFVTVRSNLPPQCSMQVSCVYHLENDPKAYVISLDEAGACVVLDASNSSDPESDPLTFNWSLLSDQVPLSAPVLLEGPRVMHCFTPGCHRITLSVSDGLQSSTCAMTLCVLTASEAVDRCAALVDSLNLPARKSSPLLGPLKSASTLFSHSHFVEGLNRLEMFNERVQSLLGAAYPAEAVSLTRFSQQIMDSIRCGASRELHETSDNQVKRGRE